MMIGIGIPSSHKSIPLPKPMTTSYSVTRGTTCLATQWFHQKNRWVARRIWDLRPCCGIRVGLGVSQLRPNISSHEARSGSPESKADESRLGSHQRRKTMKKLLTATTILALGAFSVPAYTADAVTIPIIVKDTTSGYWQIVFAGARQAAKDLSVKVPELGAQSEADINGEITILENAVAEKPAAVVIAPTQFKALGQPVDEAAKKVPIIGIDSAADSKAFTSFLTTDNVQGGRIAADGMAEAIAAKYGKAEGDVALITHLPGVDRK